MAEQARKIFDLEEQKIKNVLEAIKTITPAIYIILEWGKAEEEYESYKNKTEQKEQLLKSIKLLMNSSENKHLNDLLLIEYDKEKRLKDEALSVMKLLDDTFKYYYEEVAKYRSYANLYSYINHNIINKILDIHSFETQEEFVAMLFLLNSQEDSNLIRNEKLLKKSYEMELPYDRGYGHLFCGMNDMLKALKQNLE